MTKIYLVYDKDTKIVKGNESSEATAKRKIEEDTSKDDDYFETAKTEGKIIRDYRNCEVEEAEEEEWKNHIKTYPEISKIENKKLKAEKRVKSLEELKNFEINKRQSYLKTTANEWGGAWEECPQIILDKRALARMQKEDIGGKENKEDLEDYINNNSFSFDN